MAFFAPEDLDRFSSGILDSARDRALKQTFASHSIGEVMSEPVRKSMSPANDKVFVTSRPGLPGHILGYNS